MREGVRKKMGRITDWEKILTNCISEKGCIQNLQELSKKKYPNKNTEMYKILKICEPKRYGDCKQADEEILMSLIIIQMQIKT